MFKPGDAVVVNGQYAGEFVRETEHRVAILMEGVTHVFIKKAVILA